MFEYTTEAGKKYFLNTKMVKLNGDKEYPIFFFSKDHRPETSTDLPADREVVDMGNRLPVIKKKKA